jgi:hypothetical protein
MVVVVVVVGWRRGGEGGGRRGGVARVGEDWLAESVVCWAFGGGGGGGGWLSSFSSFGDSDRWRLRRRSLLVTISARFSASVMVASFDFGLVG